MVWQRPQLINSSRTSSHSLSLSESHPGLPGAEASPCARLSLYVRFHLIWTQLLCSSNIDSENPESFFISSHKGSRRRRRIGPDIPSSPPPTAVRKTSGKQPKERGPLGSCSQRLPPCSAGSAGAHGKHCSGHGAQEIAG